MNELEEIQKWFFDQCDDDWEHAFGVNIGTLDNPGWAVEIDLEGTPLEGLKFNVIEKGVGKDAIQGDNDWYTCKIEKKVFKGFGGPFHLGTILRIFLNWQKDVIS